MSFATKLSNSIYFVEKEKSFQEFWNFLTSDAIDTKQVESSSKCLNLIENKKYVIWISNTEQQFEQWWNEKTFWNENTEIKTLNRRNFIIESQIEKTKLENTRFEQNDMKLSF